jgi:outer membrane receptor protein involved in Fe transport
MHPDSPVAPPVRRSPSLPLAAQVALVLLACGAGTLARAQQAPAAASAQAPADLGDVVVTGSRIQQPNMTSTSPIQVVSQEEIRLQGTTDVVDLLNTLPQLYQNSATDFSNTSNPLSGPGGLTTANLRGLGPQRTLVLVDGRRLGVGDANTGNPNPAPDLDQIPPQLIRRVDVVTGGASATYGSDAVAGVVNFVLRRDFEGVEFDAQYGGNFHRNDNAFMQGLLRTAGEKVPKGSVNDGQTKAFSLLLGTNVADGRGNVTAYLNYRQADPIRQGARDFSACQLHVAIANGIASPACAGTANSNLFTVAATNQDYTVVGNQFLPWPQAGSNPPALFNSNLYNYLSRGDERYMGGFLASYDLSPFARPYAEFGFMNDRSTVENAPSGLFYQSNPLVPSTGLLVNCDNPFLSAQQQGVIGCTPADIAAGNSKDLYIGRRNVEGGGRKQSYEHQNYRGVFGLKGDAGGGFKYDAYLQYYYTTLQQTSDNYFSWQGINRALQVVDVGGVPTCKAKRDNVDPNCVPYNIFQEGGVTPEAVAYLNSLGTQYGSVEERIVSATVNGDLGRYGVKLPTADEGVGVAFGAEHRRDRLLWRPDQASLSGDLSGFGGASVAIDATNSVKEYFAELRAPLVQGRPFLQDLVAEAGYRHSDYQLSGGVNTWKLGLQWAPVDDVRLRASLQQAIRAPNIIELFTPQAITNSPVLTSDPCAGANPTATLEQCMRSGVLPSQYGLIPQCPSGQCSVVQGGNEALDPERARTISVGFTATPRFAPGLTASLDWYRIRLTGVIGTVPANVVLASCLETGSAVDCAAVRRSASGSLVGASVASGGYVVNNLINVAASEFKGIDAQLAYRLEIGRFGTLTTSLAGSYVDKSLTSNRPGDPFYDCAGLFGPTCGNVTPAWRHSLRVSWQSPWNVLASLNWRYFGKVRLDSNDPDPTLNNGQHDPFNAEIPAYSYLDASAIWTVRPTVSVRVGVNNVLDKNPPLVSTFITGTGAPNTYPSYDLLGRVAFVGVTAKL